MNALVAPVFVAVIGLPVTVPRSVDGASGWKAKLSPLNVTVAPADTFRHFGA